MFVVASPLEAIISNKTTTLAASAGVRRQGSFHEGGSSQIRTTTNRNAAAFREEAVC